VNLDAGETKRLLTGVTWGGLQPQRVVWSPLGDELLVSYQGDLYLASLTGDPPRALTDDGRSSNAVWR
jgi:hypothetical protein